VWEHLVWVDPGQWAVDPLLVLAVELCGGLIEAEEGIQPLLDLLALRVLGHGPTVGLLLLVEAIDLHRYRESKKPSNIQTNKHIKKQIKKQ